MADLTFDPDLLALIESSTDAEIEDLVRSLTPAQRAVLAGMVGDDEETAPGSPLEQALALDSSYLPRPHLTYLSERITRAVRDVEAGRERRLIIEMPPRSGKTTLATIFSPLWVLRHHPDWPIALTSHDGRLATSWGRAIRRHIEQSTLGLSIAPDAGAASEWETTRGGKVLSISVRESFTGRGAKMLVIDDPHKDYEDAHSAVRRQSIWDWWLTVAQMRLNRPALVVVIMTRWHEDDLVGRLLSKDFEGDPSDWERIRLPAIADDPATDVLGRADGEPLLSPLTDETPEEALDRWAETRRSVGSYAWSALMQQSPSPAQGKIFNANWWRFWTSDPAQVTEDGRVVYADPAKLRGTWLDSWDMAFKATDSSDYVVGQRWVRSGVDRYLIAQQRGRWSFTQSLERMTAWGDGRGPYGRNVHARLVEDKANGTAVIDTLKDKISGLIPVNPTESKAARARSITPEVEAGNVLLPFYGMPGFDWVVELLSELREFDSGAHDDQVDALTQALRRLHDPGRAQLSNPDRFQSAPVKRQLSDGSRRAPGKGKVPPVSRLRSSSLRTLRR